MHAPSFLTRFAAAAGVALALMAPAQAQSMAAQNAAFDQRFNSWLGNAQRQNAQAQQQLWQQHLRINGPRLQRHYQQLLASGNRGMTFQQFAYWARMTAAGTNVPGALQHQRNQFAGLLPHTPAPGQTWRDAQNNVYAQDAQGSYYRAENGGWVPLRPAR